MQAARSKSLKSPSWRMKLTLCLTASKKRMNWHGLHSRDFSFPCQTCMNFILFHFIFFFFVEYLLKGERTSSRFKLLLMHFVYFQAEERLEVMR